MPLSMEREASGRAEGVVTIRLEQPGKPVVVLDLELIQRLEATLKAVPSGTRGVVLASASERVFVAGADLKTISAASDPELDRYLAYGARVFGMLRHLNMPTVAALNGAALGGGLELAMHCDALVAAPSASGKPYPIGLPEAGLGLCPGWGGTNLLPLFMPDAAEAISRTCSGKPLTFDEAKSAGILARIADTPADLLNAAQEEVIRLAETRQGAWGRVGGEPEPWRQRPDRARAAVAAMNQLRGTAPETDASKAVLEAVNVGVTEGYAAALACERRHLVRLRHTPAAKTALEAFFAKSK